MGECREIFYKGEDTLAWKTGKTNLGDQKETAKWNETIFSSKSNSKL